MNEYDENDHIPKSTRRFKLYDEGGQDLGSKLIFEAYSSGLRDYEVYYGSDGNMLNYSEFSNNNDQQPVSRKYFSKDSILMYYTLYSYNQNRQMVLSEKFDRDSTLIGHRVFEYSYSNSVASKEITFVSDTLYMHTERTFENCYNVSEEVDLSYNGQVESRIRYSFMSNGLPKSFMIEDIVESKNIHFIYQYE
ncbi:MAG: hypothetical protein AAFN93_23870 [Bacteroidota bacterium]